MNAMQAPLGTISLWNIVLSVSKLSCDYGLGSKYPEVSLNLLNLVQNLLMVSTASV